MMPFFEMFALMNYLHHSTILADMPLVLIAMAPDPRGHADQVSRRRK